jgi:hypothetical protein
VVREDARELSELEEEHEDILQCGKPEHFIADCPEKVENWDNYKHKSKTDGKYRSRSNHKSKHKDE